MEFKDLVPLRILILIMILVTRVADTGFGAQSGAPSQWSRTHSLSQCLVVIGCDGVHSAVAQWLGLSKTMKAGRSAVRGLSLYPEGHGFKMQVRQFIKGGVQLDIPISPELILKDVTTNLAKDFPLEFLAVTKNTDLSTLTWAILIFRAPWDIALGQAHSGNVIVAGDAMHPMTPEIK
ncbi:Zeaxanthin epoxidase [Carex littledalei]|uniref:Zeaxanthin epoxidase n=1 Tax=Carex littledalei TaxID=544730 RepID=A0A833RTJ9_9POAL|nr:Zeaxanthin epoxidase [Carex littledalei]